MAPCSRTLVALGLASSVGLASGTFATLTCEPDACQVNTCSELQKEWCPSQSDCFKYSNYHYDYSNICAQSEIKGECFMPTKSTGKSHKEAEAMCSAVGARLCSMTELRFDVARDSGCDVENNQIWTLTTCPGGYVTQGGTWIDSQTGSGSACESEEQERGVVCCSSDIVDEVCVSETADMCSSEFRNHTCCDDFDYTYNPVPCADDQDCWACIEPVPDTNGVYGSCPQNPKTYEKKVEMPDAAHGFMCCNIEPAQATCEDGHCLIAPCRGGEDDGQLSFLDPQWSHPRGDEWSRAECSACHGNGCDQCNQGFFKFDYDSACVAGAVIKGCADNYADFHGCQQCSVNEQRTKCEVAGDDNPAYCCETGAKTMCMTCQSTSGPGKPTTGKPTTTTLPVTTTTLPVTTTTLPVTTTTLPVTTTTLPVTTTTLPVTTTTERDATTTTKHAAHEMVCEVNCYGTAGTSVPLPGQAEGDDRVVVNSETECIKLCEDTPECEGVVFHETTNGCFGRRDISLGGSATGPPGCLWQSGYKTIVLQGSRPGPWSKCSVLGDPHITTFDNHIMVNSFTGYKAITTWATAGLYGLVSSDKYLIQARFGYSEEYTNAASLVGLAVRMENGDTFAVGFTGLPAGAALNYEGWEVYYNSQLILESAGVFTVPGTNAKASLMWVNPDDYCDECRAPVMGAGYAWAYVFEIDDDMQIFVLPGKDFANAVITMRKQVGQTGLCGNFNCIQQDDTEEAVESYPGFAWASETIFPEPLVPPTGWDTRRGLPVEEALARCPDSAKEHCGPDALSMPVKQNACAFDACMKYSSRTWPSALYADSGPAATWSVSLLPAACSLAAVMAAILGAVLVSSRRFAASSRLTRLATADSTDGLDLEDLAATGRTPLVE